MFRRIHVKLTIINSIVFIVLISVLGSLIYLYTYSNVYKYVDKSLIKTVKLLENREISHREFRFARDPRVIILVWDNMGNLMIPHPKENRFKQNEATIRPKIVNEIYETQIENYTFRTFAKKMETRHGTFTVQIIRNVNSEKELLDRLLILLIIGCGIGILLAVVLGYFLAGRALIPIQDAWKKQQQFVSDASHEIRTPLAVIQSKTDVLFREPSATIEEKVLDLSIISNECRRLTKLVTNLLTLARSDSNQLEVKKQMFSFDELLHEVVEHYSEIASYQEKTIHLDVASPISFFGDRERIHQLIVILIDNALKYTNENGRIQLSCNQHHSNIIFRIQDDGIGIKEEDLPKIFNRFYQSDKARTISEGAGLGLSIAKWIIDNHQGKVKVTSKPGLCTIFEIVFPKKTDSK